MPFGGRIREALAGARHLVEESGKSVNQAVAFGGRMREVGKPDSCIWWKNEGGVACMERDAVGTGKALLPIF